MSEYKRLTKREGDFIHFPTCFEKCNGATDFSICANCEDYREQLETFCAYEDIGSPEEFAELAKAKAEGRLVEVVRCKDCHWHIDVNIDFPYIYCSHYDAYRKREYYCAEAEEAEQGQKNGGEEVWTR